MTDTRAWIQLADQAALDPSLSQDTARRLAGEIQSALQSGEWDAIPQGYLYAGAYKLIATVENLETEPIAAPPAPSLQTSAVPPQVQWRVPFDCLIYAVSAYARPNVDVLGDWPFRLAGAPDGRDLFSVRWALNGTIDYATTGHSQSLLLPASLLAGTGNRPRPMAWMVGRRDTISFQFRNITNAFGAIFGNTLATCNVTMSVLRLEPS